MLTIAFNRPNRLNALSGDLMNDAAEVLERLDDAVRVVVLRGVGRAFSAGADIAHEDLADPVDTGGIDAANRLVHAIRDAPVPVVAAVNGPAVGVGSSIALAADLTIAKESAYFYLAFANIGLMPDGGATALVPAAVGRARAGRMMFLAERIPAAQAERWGLISLCVPDADFESEIDAVVSQLADGPTSAYAATKRVLNATSLDVLGIALAREREEQSRLFGSTDFAEGLRAFSEKRRPNFAGKPSSGTGQAFD